MDHDWDYERLTCRKCGITRLDCFVYCIPCSTPEQVEIIKALMDLDRPKPEYSWSPDMQEPIWTPDSLQDIVNS